MHALHHFFCIWTEMNLTFLKYFKTLFKLYLGHLFLTEQFEHHTLKEKNNVFLFLKIWLLLHLDNVSKE